MEKRVSNAVVKAKAIELFKQVETLGEVMVVTIASFHRVGQFSSYCRCESKRISNGKKKGEGSAKNGNKYLSWAFIEAAAVAMRSCPQARRFY